MNKIKNLNKYQKLGLCIVPFVIIIVVFVVVIINSGLSIGSSTVDKKNDSTYSYCTGLDYHIDTNATDLQKEQFKKLNEAIKSGDDTEIAKQVAKNFVADFFNWTDKQDTYDVGGIYYVYSPMKINIYNRARSSFYKYLSTYKEEYGSEELLEVNSIQVESINKTDDYEFEGKTYSSYYIRVNWTYTDHKFDSSKFMNVANIQIIKNKDNRFEIVEFYGDM